MAFNVRPGKGIKKVWGKISDDTDILITHGPPKGILDAGVGCEELWQRVNKVKPRVHCFGHAHGVNGVLEKNGITYINSALINSLDPFKHEEYKLIGKTTYLNL
jgi:Icc-related predicted phosphoesterase